MYYGNNSDSFSSMKSFIYFYGKNPKVKLIKSFIMKKSENTLNEVSYVKGSKVLLQDGHAKTILNENIQKSGYMSIEEAK